MKPPILFSVFVLSISMFGQETGVDKAQVSIPGVKGVLGLNVGKTVWDAHVRADGQLPGDSGRCRSVFRFKRVEDAVGAYRDTGLIES
jgi:hypothetical protein